MAKKTPSARVIAAQLINRALHQVYALTPEQITEICGSRVSESKQTNVFDYVGQITGKTRQRVVKIMRDFENPPPRKPPAGKPFQKKQPEAAPAQCSSPPEDSAPESAATEEPPAEPPIDPNTLWNPGANISQQALKEANLTRMEENTLLVVLCAEHIGVSLALVTGWRLAYKPVADQLVERGYLYRCWDTECGPRPSNPDNMDYCIATDGRVIADTLYENLIDRINIIDIMDRIEKDALDWLAKGNLSGTHIPVPGDVA